jgi:hypothetical protein
LCIHRDDQWRRKKAKAEVFVVIPHKDQHSQHSVLFFDAASYLILRNHYHRSRMFCEKWLV